MLEKQRHQLIVDTVDAEHFISVRALTELLESSEATIRRDLHKLDRAGRLRRIRGGAESLRSRHVEHPSIDASVFWVETSHQAQVKRAIARRAVELCAEGDSIIINGGSSTYMMGEFLQDRDLHVLTNSFVLAQFLAEQSSNQITLTGGEIYRKQGIVLSSYDDDLIRNYSARRMFMGTPGLDTHGVTESDPMLVQSEQKLLRQAEQLVVLADSSKLGRSSNFIVCPLARVDILITDSGAEASILRRFRRAGVEVLVVEPEVAERA